MAWSGNPPAIACRSHRMRHGQSGCMGSFSSPCFLFGKNQKTDLRPLPESLIFNYFYDIYRHIFVFPLETAV